MGYSQIDSKDHQKHLFSRFFYHLAPIKYKTLHPFRGELGHLEVSRCVTHIKIPYQANFSNLLHYSASANIILLQYLN
jgi:hypothetical protein